MFDALEWVELLSGAAASNLFAALLFIQPLGKAFKLACISCPSSLRSPEP